MIIIDKNFKRTPPFQSKLIPYQDEILNAWRNRKTLREIRDVLEEKGIHITIQSISSFIRCRLRRADPHEFSAPPEPEPQGKPRSVTDIRKALEAEMAKTPAEREREYVEMQWQKRFGKKQ